MEKLYCESYWKSSFLILLLMLFLVSCTEENLREDEKIIHPRTEMFNENQKKPIPDNYIVVLSKKPAGQDQKAGAALEALSKEVGNEKGAKINYVYKNSITGFAAKLTGQQVKRLKKDPRVLRVEQDVMLYLNNDIVVQDYPAWGLDRMDQRERLLDRAYTYTATGTGVTAYIVDSGINYSHQEFSGRARFGKDLVLETEPEITDPSQQPGEDCHGHGTHVAGTVGGEVYGMAKDVELVSVRVFGCIDGSPTSRVVAAVDWITTDALNNGTFPAVVNMSLGGELTAGDTSLNDAIVSSLAAGVVYVVAAGNNNGDACLKEPASTEGAITVGASDLGDMKASFSNFGECVDVYAPGVRTLAAYYKDNTSVTSKSGTSMASPHVAGMVALYLEQNSQATPSEVHAAVVSNATPNAVSNVPSGTTSLAYSHWNEIEFTPPAPPDLMLKGSGVKEKGEHTVYLEWQAINSGYYLLYKDGVAIARTNKTNFRHDTGIKGNDASYVYKVCEENYANCSEVLIVFGDGGGELVTNMPPTANFSFAGEGLTVSFADLSDDSDGSIAKWLWEFGDGSTSTLQHPQHTYTSADHYPVKLTVTDDLGATGYVNKGVDVFSEETSPAPGLILSVTGSKVRGEWQSELSWDPSEAQGNLDVYRDDMKIAVTGNTGYFLDRTSNKGGGSLTYKICEAGTATCSNEVTVQF